MLGASTTRVKAGQQAQHDEPRPTMNGVSHDGIITNVPAATCPCSWDYHVACVNILMKSDDERNKVAFVWALSCTETFKSGSNAGPPSYVSPC
jgi:hypothetical protein